MVTLSGGGEATAEVVFDAVEAEAVFAEKFRGDFGNSEVVVVGRGGEIDETVEVKFVVTDGVDGAAKLDLDVFEEVADEVTDGVRGRHKNIVTHFATFGEGVI